ncbi:MAG: Survival protein SurE-like phosphatase/nucleotidase, partial [Firmicutes bacterium]|nr:Survival protein SurE-like phosphatase/nucleotidase [Bacillota bacterium]
EIQGIAITKLGSIEYENAFDKRVDPRGRTYYWMAGTPMETLNASDTDVAAIRANQISLTPVHFDLTDYTLFESLQQWETQHRSK